MKRSRSMSEAPSLSASVLLTDQDRLVTELSAIPMLAGISNADLLEFGAALTPRELDPGAVLWRQAAPAQGLYILLSGEVTMFRRLPGEREFEVGKMGPGTVFGGILLLGGGIQLSTARVTTACSLLFLPGDDFHARMQLRQPSALRLKARILENTCSRIREDHAWITEFISKTPNAQASDRPPRGCAVPAPMPAQAYVSRLPFFSGWPGPAVASLLETGDALRFAPGCTLIDAGEMPSRCFVVLNGAVEDVLEHGTAVVRVRFAGPGRACGHLSFLGHQPATVTSRARERTIALAVAAEDFRRWLRGSDPVSRNFTAAIESELMTTLHATASPKAYLLGTGPR